MSPSNVRGFIGRLLGLGGGLSSTDWHSRYATFFPSMRKSDSCRPVLYITSTKADLEHESHLCRVLLVKHTSCRGKAASETEIISEVKSQWGGANTGSMLSIINMLMFSSIYHGHHHGLDSVSMLMFSRVYHGHHLGLDCVSTLMLSSIYHGHHLGLGC